MKTVVGLYNSVAQANQVKSALVSQGFDSSDITVIDQTDNDTTPSSSYRDNAATAGNDASIGSKIKNFFGSLTGHDEDAHRSYTEGVTGGGAMVAVNADEDEADEVADFLHAQGASSIQGGYGNTESSSYANTATTGRGSVTSEQVIPVVAEELEVGKRQVERGGVRVYSRVVSEPVSESVSLHDERVVVDRHAVNRPATDADFTTGTGVIEVNATGEEAVVGKRSRVVEEVLVGKQASDRTEEITDTVRHTEVDVQPVTTGTRTSETTSGSAAGNYRGTDISTDLDR